MTETTQRLDFANALVRVARLVGQVFDEASRDHDLTPQQTHMLCVLLEGPVGMTELRGALDLEKSSLTGLVDRAERRGLATRVRDRDDRRACQVTLTDDGVKLAGDAHNDVVARLEELAHDVPRAEQDVVSTVVARLDSRATSG